MLKPTLVGSKRDNRVIYNFRWLKTGFDFVRFKSGSFFIQYGKYPIKYLCYIKPDSDPKEFFFLTRRTNKNWVPKRQFKIFKRLIKTGTTATPLKISGALKIKFNNGSQICLSSQKLSSDSSRDQIRSLKRLDHSVE